MTSNVTSIARIRTAARARAERAKSNNRTTTVLLLVAMVLVVIGLGETMSASSTVGINQAADRFYFFKRQLLGSVSGWSPWWWPAGSRTRSTGGSPSRCSGPRSPG